MASPSHGVWCGGVTADATSMTAARRPPRPSSRGGSGAAACPSALTSQSLSSPRREFSPIARSVVRDCPQSSSLVPVPGGVPNGCGVVPEAPSPPKVESASLPRIPAQPRATPSPPPMSYPLFAGWGDAEKFSSLVEKDVARLQRRIAELRSNAASALRGTGSRNGGGDASTASMGRRELVDPAACTRSLAAMLLGTDALAQGSHFAGGPRAESPQRREHQWRTLCNELAKRAAHLEVLLAMLAEAMVVHLVGSGASYSKASAALADAAGCPSTRIGRRPGCTCASGQEHRRPD
mmetsp:Transcript_90504/g.255489  ORF Transcript_90504/g.255489 Transcript_90504/m.255489 type:complete len:294 (+) Transcript_90504:61-942(+)